MLNRRFPEIKIDQLQMFTFNDIDTKNIRKSIDLNFLCILIGAWQQQQKGINWVM